MTQSTGFQFRTRMTARDITEPHRASSPLELLFDLTFVVAIAQLTVQLAHAIADGHAGEAVGPFLMVFFAIWWAWMNFTWFASSYDTDDVPYRVLTMVQMAGVLVLAAGVPAAFDSENFTTITIGYCIMRVGLALHWLRAGLEHREGRATAWRYAAGVTAVQLGWLLRLLLPAEWGVISFLVLAALDLSVPLWAQRTGHTSWHPHHIAERYGLFTIIVLGESVLAATVGMQNALGASGVNAALVVIGISSLVLLFALWWLYFLEPAGDGLENNRDLSFAWGYGHYGIFAALAALGAGLEVAVEVTGHHSDVPSMVVGFAVAVPVGVFLILLWAVHAPIVEQPVIQQWVILPAAALVILLPLATDVIGLIAVIVAITLVCVAVIGVTLVGGQRRVAAATTEAGR